jgi:hypothetical protein
MRKLKFNEVMIISRLLRELDIKNYIDELMKKDFKNPQSISIDVIAFILSNICLAQNTAYELVRSYTGIEDVENMDVDAITECFKNMFTNGLPKVLLDVIDVEGIKKKMNSENQQ